jgi:hypothetical protein
MPKIELPRVAMELRSRAAMQLSEVWLFEKARLVEQL